MSGLLPVHEAASSLHEGSWLIVRPGSTVDAMSKASSIVWELDVETFSDDQLIVAAVVQGLANRRGPRVYLSMTNRHWQMKLKGHCRPEGDAHHSGETLSHYRSCTDVWREYYGQTQGLEFRPVKGLADLLGHVRDEVSGVILFDPDSSAEIVIATTLAGLRNAIPVTDTLFKAEPALATWPILEDLRGRYPDSLEAQRWAARVLQPQCSRHAVYSQTRTINEGDPDYFSLDLVASQKLFAFNLGCYRSKTPEEFELAQEILGRYPPGTPMYGWGTSESSMMVLMAKSGHFLVCTHTPNISFHAQIKPRHYPFRQKRRFAREAVRLEDKCYIAFMVNEGDTLKWMGSVMGHGQWLEPERGTLPVNWGTNAWLVETYGGMMEMFYETMSENDLFFSSITGYGYYNPKLSSATELLARKEAEHNPAADLTIGSIYSVHGMMDATNGKLDAATDRWLVDRGCAGYVFEAAQRPYVKFTSAGQPVIGVDWSLFYWMYRFDAEDRIGAVVEHIEALAAANPAPLFIPVYAGSPSQFQRIAARLPKERFKVVLLDEMVELARQAGPSVRPVRSSVASRAEVKRKPAGRFIGAPRATIEIDGDPRKWDALGGQGVEHDLTMWGAGQCRARYRWAWDDEKFYLLIEELHGPSIPMEAWDASYAVDEFDMVDGAAFWMDFDGNGTSERGDYTAWFGFSSRGRNDLYCCQLNNRVLSSPFPPAQVATAGKPGSRIIEAAIRWEDLAHALDEDHTPADGFPPVVKPGYRFGCQPLLIEGRAGRAFLNGRSNKRQNTTAAALDSDGSHRILAPTGFDDASLWIELLA